MTTETIERLAREADLIADPTGIGYFSASRLERFAALVRAEALEEAAQLLDASAERLAPDGKRVNQADQHTAYVLETKAGAIRALASK